MVNERIQSEIETALDSLEPVEVKLHLEPNKLLVLVLSDKFEEEPYSNSFYHRISKCLDLITDYASDELNESYDILVEPVTPAEFKERLVPWPE